MFTLFFALAQRGFGPTSDHLAAARLCGRSAA